MMTKTAVCILIGLAAGSAFAQDAAPVEEFEKRLHEYLKVRKTACEAIPKLKNKATPEEIAANKHAQAEAIRVARSNAAQGDIFTPGVAAYLKNVISTYLNGPGRRPAKEAVKQGNPAEEGEKVVLKANAIYPDDAPLSTVPPGLLLRLPKLPNELSYRFVGPHLVLHDGQAGIIVDFVPKAMP